MGDDVPPKGTGRVGFLTEVDIEHHGEKVELPALTDAKVAATPAVASRSEAQASSQGLPFISVYKVEDAEIPSEAFGPLALTCPLPSSIPIEKVMTNIAQNLDYKASAGADQARNQWFKEFKSPSSRAVINDTFWFCVCWYFKSGKHPNIEQRLFHRISSHFVGLFSTVTPSRKDFFFKSYADAVAQAVLYSMFLAYPKSRANFTDKFRRDLVTRISYWTTGICPEFVDTSHWKLNLGGGDVLQTASQPQHSKAGGSHDGLGLAKSAPTLANQLSVEQLVSSSASLAHRAPRPRRSLRFSPLVAHFLRSRKYTSGNVVPVSCVKLTLAEERTKLMDVKHSVLVDRTVAVREHCDKLSEDYDSLAAEMKQQERQRVMQAAAAKRRLEIRRKEVLRTDPHEYANYLVSLHLLQQGFGQT